MTIYTYQFSKSLAESLGISHTETINLSDQILSESAELFDNYVPYGGGAKGSKNGHFGLKHTEEAKEKMRQKALGRPAPNKGIANPAQKERFIKNNPMKNPEIASKVVETRRKNHSWVSHEGCFKKGQKPHNYIDEMRTFYCDTCNKENVVRNVRDGKTRRFCNRSCQATFTNKNRRGYKSIK